MAIIKRKTGKDDVEVYMRSKRVVTKRGFRTKMEAKGFHDQMLIQYGAGARYARNPNISLENLNPTFNDLLESYTRLHLSKVRIQTRERYKTDIEKRLKPRFQYMPLTAITTEMVFEMQSQLLKTLNPKSVNNCRR
jgi:hypothetical protein